MTSGIFGAKISIRSETVQKLADKFGRKPLEDFLHEFNTAGSIEALTEKEGRFILKQPSLDALRNRILKGAQEGNIPPTAWQAQTPFQRIANSGSPGLPLSDLRSNLSPIISNWKNAPDIRFVQSETELPQSIQESIKAQNAAGEVLGVWYDGKIHLVADNVKTARDFLVQPSELDGILDGIFENQNIKIK